MAKKINDKKRVVKDGSDLKGPLSIEKKNKGIDTIAGVMIKPGLNRLTEADWEKIKGYKVVKNNLTNDLYIAKEGSKTSFNDKKEKDKKDKK